MTSTLYRDSTGNSLGQTLPPFDHLAVHTQLDGLVTYIGPVGWGEHHIKECHKSPVGWNILTRHDVQAAFLFCFLYAPAPPFVSSLAGAMCIFGRLQRVCEHSVQRAGVLQSDSNAHERPGHAVPRRPVELAVVSEDRVRAREGEVGAEAGSLGARERVVERLCSALACKREREEAAEAAAG